MKIARRWNFRPLTSLAALFSRTPAANPARRPAARLARRSGMAHDGMTLDTLEQRQLLFVLTITPDLVDPATGLGTVQSNPFAYVIPRFNIEIPDPDDDNDPVIEDFDDEMDPWTQVVPPAAPNPTDFDESNIRLTYRGPTPNPVTLGRIGGTGMANQFLNVSLNTTDVVTFTFFNESQGTTPPTQRLAIATSLTIRNGPDGNPLRTDINGTRLELLNGPTVVATFTGAALAALAVPVGGGALRYDINFPGGFDAFRFSSAQDAPANSAYSDSFIIDSISTTFPTQRFAQSVTDAVFGAIISFTGPAGATLDIRDAYDAPLVETLRALPPPGSELPEIDRNGDGIPDYNDGIGRIIINGTNADSGFSIVGGTVVQNTGPLMTADIPGDGGWKLVVTDPNGQLDAFEDAGFGFTFSDSGDGIIGLPENSGSVIIGNPYLRNRTNSDTYFISPGPNFSNPAHGLVVNGTIGMARIDGPLFGFTRAGAVERLSAGALYGSIAITGDAGQILIASDAGSWYSEDDEDVAPNNNPAVDTGSRITVGRTVREIAVAGRSTADIEVLGDINNAARPTLNFRDFYSAEVTYWIPRIATAVATTRESIALDNTANWRGQATAASPGVGVVFGDTWLRNDAVQGAEYVGYNGTSVRVFGALNGHDPIATAQDRTDVYAFPADPTREVVISAIDPATGAGGTLPFANGAYARIVDRDGRVVAAVDSDAGLPGRGPDGYRGGQQFIRFRPERADTYYLVINDGNADQQVGTPYGVQIDGMAPVTFGALRTGGTLGAVVEGGFVLPGQGEDRFVLSVLAGNLGAIRAGVGYVTGGAAVSNADAITNTNQTEKAFYSLGAGSINVAGSLHSVYVGSDIRGTQIAVGGDLGTIATGRGPTPGQSVNVGDLYAAEIRVGGRIALLDITGGIAIDQVGSPTDADNRNGIVSIATGRNPSLSGDIGQILVGAYVQGNGLEIITSDGSVFDQFRVGISPDVGNTDFPGFFVNTTPLIRMGRGSDLRFVDALVHQSTTSADNFVRIAWGDTIRLTDDSGAIFEILITGGNAGTILAPGPARGSFADIRLTPVDGSLGAAISRITTSLFGNADLVVTAITPGVVSLGTIVANIAADATGGTPATPTGSSLRFLSTATGESEIDVGLINTLNGNLLNLSNTTVNGDFVALDLAGVRNVSIAGDLGRTQVNSGWVSGLLGPFLGIGAKGGGGGGGDAGGPLGIDGDAVNEWSGGTYQGITAGFGTPAPLEIIGSPIDPYLNGLRVRGGDVINVAVTGAVGDVLIEGGDLLQLTANSDGDRSGRFQGIVGTVYASSIGLIDVGDGLAGSGAGPLAQAGIFADNTIFNVTAGRGLSPVLGGVIAAAGQGGPLSTLGAGADLRVFIPAGTPGVAGIALVTVTDGQIDNAWIGAQFLEDFWQAPIGVADQPVNSAEARSVQITGGNLFRSRVGGGLVGDINITGGAFDASSVNSSSTIGTITADEFRNSLRFGQDYERIASRIISDAAVAGIDARTGVISDLNVEIGTNIGRISARTILQSLFEVTGRIDDFNATDDIRGVTVSTGNLVRLNAGGDIRLSSISASGPIQTLTAGGEITQVAIEAAGPDARIDTVRAQGLLQGTISATGNIGIVESVSSDVAADIQTRLFPGRTQVPGLATLTAGRDYVGSLIILGNTGTITVGRNIALFGQTNPVLDLRGNLGSIDAGSGQIYSDVQVGQSITGTITIGRVNMRPGTDRVSTAGIVAFGRINSVIVNGDLGGNITSRSGGIGSITINEGSVRPTSTITVADGALTTLTINGGDLLGDVLVDGDIGTIALLPGASNFVGNIGVADAKRNSTQFRNDIRNQLPPGVQRTAGLDGVLISASGSIANINVSTGGIWESRIIAGVNIDSITVRGAVRNDGLTTGTNSQFVAGQTIGSITVGALASGVGIVAGVRSLGADQALGGTGVNADVLGPGRIDSVRLNGASAANTFVSAGIAPDASGNYNTAGSFTAGGVSSIGTVFARRATNVSVFTDGARGTVSPGIRVGGRMLPPVDSSRVINTGTPGETNVPAGTPFAFTTSSGQNATLLFSGPGRVLWLDSSKRFRLVNTTSATSLTISRPASGPISGLTVLGNSNAALGTLTVNAQWNGGSVLYVDGGITTATFNGIVNTTGLIGTGGNITTLTFNRAFTSGNLEAGRVTMLDLNNNVGSGATIRTASITTVTVAGVLRGRISSDASITTFTAGSIDGGGVRSGGSIATITTGAVNRGQISAYGNLPSVTINGNVNESTILAGADLGADADFGGTGFDADRVSNGTLGTLTVSGNFQKSDAAAGVLRGTSGYLGNPDARAAAGRSAVQTVTIAGNLVGSTLNSEQFRVASTGAIGTVSVAGRPFSGSGNFLVEPGVTIAVPVRIDGLRVTENSRTYSATITFNQPIDQATLSSALSITELRSGGSVTVGLAEGTDYTLRYDAVRREAIISFNRAVTSRSLPQQPGVPGPGVYQFRLSGANFRGSTQDSLLDGNADGSAGDDWARNDVVGDAGDKINPANPTQLPTIDFYGAADLDLVLRTDVSLGSLPQVNNTYTLRGVAGDHPDTNPLNFRSGGDVDVYRISLRAGQIVRMSALRGVGQQAARAVYNAAGQPIVISGGSGFQTDAALPGLRRLPNDVSDSDLLATPEDQYLVTQTGTYFIVISSALSDGANTGLVDIANPNIITDVAPIGGAVGAYEFDIQVFDDQDSGFVGDTASGTGAQVAYAPVPAVFAGPDGTFGTGDDLQTFVTGDWTFRLSSGPTGPSDRATVVRGTNSRGWVSERRSATDGTFGGPNDRLTVNIASSIGLPDTVGRPATVSPDVDVFTLNNGQPIAPGTRIRATLRLTERGSNLGLSQEVVGRFARGLDGDNVTLFERIALRPTVQLGVFELQAGVGFDNARLVGAPSEILPTGAQPASTTTNGQTSYGYDANGDFFFEFLAPGAQGIDGLVPAVYALALQGSIRSDYNIEISQSGQGDPTARGQNVLLETLGGTIDWLQAGRGVTTNLDAFDAAALGFTGQVDGAEVGTFIISSVVTRLNTLFAAANANITVATTPAGFQRQDFSTVFIAGNVEPSPFLNNDTFGASEHRDFLNADRNDEAVVFAPALGELAYDPSQTGVDRFIQSLTAAVARRIGELVGLSLETSSFVTTTTTPVMGFDSVSLLPSTGGTTGFTAADRALARATDNTSTTTWFIGSQNSLGLLNRVVGRRS